MKLSTLSKAVLIVGGAVQIQAFSPSSTRSPINSKSPPSFPNDSLTIPQTKHDPLFGNYRTSQLFMGWGPDPIWKSATVTSNYAACPSEGSVCLTIDVPSSVMEGYLTPGQYVQMKNSVEDEDAKPIFLAIASAPPDEDAKPIFLAIA